LSSDIITKRLDLLRQILPDIRRVGFLYNPDNSSSVLNLRQFESDCAKFKFNPIPAPARKVEEIAAAFNKMKRDKAQGMIVIGGATLAASRVIVVNLAAKHRLPVIYGQIDYIDAGGLISYAPNLPDLWRRAANYADKIFKGAKPSDLPIEQPVKFDLVLNMKTAKALGIKIPGSVLVQANKVIE
jgi:putative ABC transport system substrate-binding protein